MTKKECEFKFCDDMFEQQHRNQKYCEEHRQGGSKHRELRRVKTFGWNHPNYVKIKECEIPSCDKKFKVKHKGTKYCTEHRGSVETVQYCRMKSINRFLKEKGYEYRVSFEEAGEFITLQYSLYWKSRKEPRLFEQIKSAMYEEEGKMFYEIAMMYIKED